MCPLTTYNPRAIGQRICQNGGSNFWNIHVGGKRTDWNKGTDAMCLSISSKPVAWGVENCQFAWNEDEYRDILVYADCLMFGEIITCYGRVTFL